VITWAWYTAILLVVGTTAAGRACAEAPLWPRRITTAALGFSLLLIAIVAARLWSQTNDAFGADGPLTLEHVQVIVFETPWGSGWMWQAGGSLCTLLAVVAWRSRWDAWPAAALCASAMAFVTALTGHAMGMEEQTWITILAHGLHVIAAGWWLGALAIILLVTSRADFERDVQARLSLAQVVTRFSPIAVAAVALLVAAGLVATWRHVIEQAGLGGFASPYGLALLAKVAAFAGAALCGLYNWRVLTPLIEASPDATRQFRIVAWLEVSLGVVALVLTALLGTLSMPERDDQTEHTQVLAQSSQPARGLD
jgi:putative copper resistance protein D